MDGCAVAGRCRSNGRAGSRSDHREHRVDKQIRIHDHRATPRSHLADTSPGRSRTALYHVHVARRQGALRTGDAAMKKLLPGLMFALIAVSASAQQPPEIPLFSKMTPGAPPQGWKPFSLASTKKNTDYTLVSEDGSWRFGGWRTARHRPWNSKSSLTRTRFPWCCFGGRGGREFRRQTMQTSTRRIPRCV